MKKIRFRHIVTLLAIIAMVGLGGNALAYRGWMNGGGGPGACSGDEDCAGYGKERRGGACGRYAQDLTEEQRTQLDEARKAHFEATRELRDQLRDKAEQLREVMTADEVNVDTAKSLQAQLSDLRAQLDQKRLEHRIEMRSLFPDLEDAPCCKGGRGKGRRGGGGRW